MKIWINLLLHILLFFNVKVYNHVIHSGLLLKGFQITGGHTRWPPHDVEVIKWLYKSLSCFYENFLLLTVMYIPVESKKLHQLIWESETYYHDPSSAVEWVIPHLSLDDLLQWNQLLPFPSVGVNIHSDRHDELYINEQFK